MFIHMRDCEELLSRYKRLMQECIYDSIGHFSISMLRVEMRRERLIPRTNTNSRFQEYT